MEPGIREACTDDVALLTGIIRESFRDVAERFGLTAENCPAHPSNYTEAQCVEEMGRGVRFFILETEGKACGCVALEHAKPDVCYLERLSVLPGYRERGFGRLLTDHVLGEAKRLGVRRVSIAIIAEHHELRDWYIKLGFRMKKTALYDHLPFEVAFLDKEVCGGETNGGLGRSPGRRPIRISDGVREDSG